MKKSKKELSEIALSAVDTAKGSIGAREMLCPLLELVKDGKEYHLKDLELPLSKKFNLTKEQLMETTPSGTKRFFHRLGWAKWLLKKGGLITPTEQFKFKISSLGITYLKENPNFTFKTFKKLPGWIVEVKRYKDKHKKKPVNERQHYNQFDVKSELLDKIKEGSPYSFEIILVKLLEKMGYGVGKVTKKSHDGGIDGIVTVDKLGLSEIYIQAKRYTGSVPISQVKEFIGTIQTTKTKTGVFITSGTLPDSAHQYVLKSGLNIQLIDGKKLSALMYDFDIGLKITVVEPIKYIDEAFFFEEGLS